MSVAAIGILGVAGLLALIFARVPIALALAATGLLGYAALDGWGTALKMFGTVPFELARAYSLSVLPLFILMGAVAARANMAREMFDAANGVFSGIRGALANATIGACAMFGAICGSSIATAATFSGVAVPEMRRHGYDSAFAAGAVASAGTLGVLIPPSVLLAIYAVVAEQSLPKLYAAAFIPGFLLAGLYLVYLLGRAFINPKLGPPVPKEERVHSAAVMVKEVLIGVVPLVCLIGAALGSILAGLATPTEAAGIGALGAGALAAAYRRLTYAGVKRAILSTTATTSMVLLLAVTSNIFGAVFARMGTANWITETMLALPLSPVMMLVVVIFLIFLLGWPFEWPAIVLVFLPIFYPVVDALKPALGAALGIPADFVMVWFGALVAVTLQTAFLSPPVAMSAYYLKQVVKDWSLATIYKGMFEFMVLQCIAIALIVVFPAIATKFPEQLREEARGVKVEQIDDSANRLEEDPLKGLQDQAAPTR